MSSCVSRAFRNVLCATIVVSTLTFAAPALAQSGSTSVFPLEMPAAAGVGQTSSSRDLLAVGGGFYIGNLLAEDGGEQVVPGFSGGFEFRPTERLSFLVEGAWTGGYEVYSSLTHESFTYLEGKMRIVLARRWQHQPYLNLGVARVWDRDFVINAGNPAGADRVRAATYFLWGGGVSFRVWDLEVRPELQLYQRSIYQALLRAGVGVWYTF